MTRAFGRNVGKVFNPVVKLVLENQPFLMPEPAEKPSLHQQDYRAFDVAWYSETCEGDGILNFTKCQVIIIY